MRPEAEAGVEGVGRDRASSARPYARLGRQWATQPPAISAEVEKGPAGQGSTLPPGTPEPSTILVIIMAAGVNISHVPGGAKHFP